MNDSHQEPSPDERETGFGSPALSNQRRRIIHFSSGETLEQEEEEEEEEEPSSNRPPFSEPAERTRMSFKNVALLVGRISLLTCDFLGERLAGALGLNAAKYQYAIDQHHRNHKVKQPAARPRTPMSEARQRRSTSTPDWVGVITELQEKQGTLLTTRAVRRNTWTPVKDVTTEPTMQMRIN
ncbi:protein FAM177A1 isoform X1 [Cyclopterus lumpus]|uniref:protein FAM177A1 isoform X1 n=1 Tax=Cyclopterus lumpus TaxID=8103 RepID=UPI001485C850|nr:protein FAM177A1 isoform X1 [Cyclopterus lumpus]